LSCAKADAPKNRPRSSAASFDHLVAQRKRHGGAVMFCGNASERCGRSGSYSTVRNCPLTLDVAFQLSNHEFLITDYAFDKIADRNDANGFSPSNTAQTARASRS
jgi:hypothetical protein